MLCYCVCVTQAACYKGEEDRPAVSPEIQRVDTSFRAGAEGCFGYAGVHTVWVGVVAVIQPFV